MKAMTKQELADRAGVTPKVLREWCRPYRSQLEQMGVGTHTKMLPPRAVKFLCETFCIDL